MENIDSEKSHAFNVIDIVEYLPSSVVIKSIIRKTTGHISAAAFDNGELLTGEISPFDNLIQIIDGKAEIVIDDKSHLLETGQSIIMPAHSPNTIKARGRFKMISTVIKSGYEEVNL